MLNLLPLSTVTTPPSRHHLICRHASNNPGWKADCWQVHLYLCCWPLLLPSACIEKWGTMYICCRFMAFDRHMNLVLGDSEEFRKLPPKKGKSDDEVGLYLQPSSTCRTSLFQSNGCNMSSVAAVTASAPHSFHFCCVARRKESAWSRLT